MSSKQHSIGRPTTYTRFLCTTLTFCKSSIDWAINKHPLVHRLADMHLNFCFQCVPQSQNALSCNDGICWDPLLISLTIGMEIPRASWGIDFIWGISSVPIKSLTARSFLGRAVAIPLFASALPFFRFTSSSLGWWANFRWIQDNGSSRIWHLYVGRFEYGNVCTCAMWLT